MKAWGEEQTVLVVDDDERLRSTLAVALKDSGYQVTEATDVEQAMAELKRRPFGLVISDVNMAGGSGIEVLSQSRERWPDTPVILVSGGSTVSEAVEAMRQGAFDFVLKPYDIELMEQIAYRAMRLSRLAPPLPEPAVPAKVMDDRPIITRDKALNNLLKTARKVAASKATVLISGESGTGKELLARFVHHHSDRSTGPFVAVNCAALPENLLESELFGHEKGAFTGAISKKEGRFELANGGTLLLDEISEMDPALQAKLLRALQENEIDRVGGRRPVAVDVRVIATTNRILKESVQQGEFRQDLYYRLNVIPLHIPPLEERRGDVGLLIDHFLEKFSRRDGRERPKLSPEAERTLLGRPWPGNVRELENVIERAVLLSSDGEVTPASFLFDDELDMGQESDGAGVDVSEFGTLKDMERAMIYSTLDRTEGNRTQAAKLLGISVRTLRNKLAEYRSATGEGG